MDLSGAFPNTMRIITSSGQVIEHDDDQTQNVMAADGVQDIFDNTLPAPFETNSELRHRNHSANPPVQEESDTESESETEEQQHPRNFLRDIVEEQNRRRANWLNKESLLYWSIHITTMLWNYSSLAAYYVYKAAQGAYRGVQNPIYYFFEHSTVAYEASHVKLNTPGAPTIDWIYDFDSRVFRRPESTDEKKHLPYLTAAVNHQDLSLYDLTDFVQSIRYCGSSAPTAQHIMAAWFLHTGILLDLSLPMTLQVCTEEGEEKTVTLGGSVAAAST